MLLYSMGAGIAIYEGIERLARPHPVKDPHINYLVLGAAILLVGVSTWKAVHERDHRRGEQGALPAPRASKDAALFTVVLENLAAMAGLLVALAGLAAADLGGVAVADGIASIAIGIILAAVAAIMSIEVQGLLIGEAAREEVQPEAANQAGADTPVIGPEARPTDAARPAGAPPSKPAPQSSHPPSTKRKKQKRRS